MNNNFIDELIQKEQSCFALIDELMHKIQSNAESRFIINALLVRLIQLKQS